MPRDTNHYTGNISRSRSRSPYRNERPHERSRHHSPSRSTSRPLPLSAQPLSKHDLPKLRPLFKVYLDVQKRIDIDDIEDDEKKGRWKSFVKKWNAGDLAEGWYDPKTLQKALNAEQQDPKPSQRPRPKGKGNDHDKASDDDGDNDEAEEEFGPALPSGDLIAPSRHNPNTNPPSATVPTISDLRARQEEAHEANLLLRTQQRSAAQAQHRLDRQIEKERLDDLTPRAAPGTRERQLENKKLLSASHQSFASSAHESGSIDVPETDLMGGSEADGISEYKRLKQNEERKKNERELRREEILRARRAEREERVKGLKEKEEKTMEYLRGIARERFG